jgi:hypothetical protein
MSFQHSIAGGNGKLVITALQSPNFIHAEQGWAINKDGSAEFHDIELPSGIGGATVYFSGTAPVGANPGDIWYNIADGLQLSQYNGTTWNSYLFGTAAISEDAITTSLIADQAITSTQISDGAVDTPQLAAGAVTADNIEAGTIVAGIIDGTTVDAATFMGSVFEGTDFEINANGAFWYAS